MDALFLKLLNMSIAASWLILAVIVLRWLLKKASKALRCVLWALVAVRLLCPFSLESVWSLVPSAETIPSAIISESSPSFDVNTGFNLIDTPVNEYLGDHYFEGVTVPANNGSQLMTALGWIWLAGVAAMLLYAIVSYLRLRQKAGAALPLEGNIRLCDEINTPFILGIIKPRVYLPSDMGEAQISYVIAHEQAHLKRRDHWWKPLGFVILAIYWFNPLIWLSYILLCRDIELACDERVVRKMDLADKKAYSAALLSCSLPRRMAVACPLAFGEVGVRERIKTVLNYKKPAFWLVTAAVAACVVAAACFLTDPKDQDLSFLNYENLVPLAYQSEALAVRHSGVAGYLDGQAVGAFLDTAAWREKRMTSPLELSADATIIFSDELELRFYESEPTLAMVVCNDDWRYYNMKNTRYEDVAELLKAAAATGKVLSLNDVIILSQKGEELSWQDFDQYAYTETGFGLYIRVYEINPLFSLWIGGGLTTEKPMYIRLTANTEPEAYIDIRTESVTDFISAHNSDSQAVAATEILTNLFNTLANDQTPVYLTLLREGDMMAGPYDGWGYSNDAYLSQRFSDYTYEAVTPEARQIADNMISLTSGLDGADWTIRFYEDSNFLELLTNGESRCFQATARFDAYPSVGTQVRSWYDEAEYQALGGGYQTQDQIVIPDRGQDYLSAAQVHCQTLEEAHLRVTSGSAYCYTYVSCQVKGAEEQTAFFREQGEIDENTWAFYLTVTFVPENQWALNWSMAGNTREYTGNDPDVPEGAYEYSRVGYITLAADGWHGNLVGTGW